MNGENGTARALIIGGILFAAAAAMITVVVLLGAPSGREAAVAPAQTVAEQMRAGDESLVPRRLPFEAMQAERPAIGPRDDLLMLKVQEPQEASTPEVRDLMDLLAGMLEQSRADNLFQSPVDIGNLENSLSSWLRRAPLWLAELYAGRLMEINFMLEAAKMERSLAAGNIEADQAMPMLDDLVLNASPRLDTKLVEDVQNRFSQRMKALIELRKRMARADIGELETRAMRLLKENPESLGDPVATYGELSGILESIEEMALFHPAANDSAEKIKDKLKPFYDAALARQMKESFRNLEGQYKFPASDQWRHEALEWLGIFENEDSPDFLKHEADRLNSMIARNDLRQRLKVFEDRIRQQDEPIGKEDGGNLELALRTNSMAMSEVCAMLLEARAIGHLSQPEQEQLEKAYKKLEAREKGLLEIAQNRHKELIREYNRWAVREIDAARKLQKQREQHIKGLGDTIFQTLNQWVGMVTGLSSIVASAQNSSANAKASYSAEDYHNDLVIICKFLSAIDLSLLDKPVLDFYHLVHEKVRAPLNEDRLHVVAVNSLEIEKRPLQQGGQAQ